MLWVCETLALLRRYAWDNFSGRSLLRHAPYVRFRLIPVTKRLILEWQLPSKIAVEVPKNLLWQLCARAIRSRLRLRPGSKHFLNPKIHDRSAVEYLSKLPLSWQKFILPRLDPNELVGANGKAAAKFVAIKNFPNWEIDILLLAVYFPKMGNFSCA
jgi:hypothetical protein